MKSQIGVVIIVCFIVLNSLLSGVFAQTLSLNQNVPLKTSKPCKQDWECRSLNITITLDQPKCYDRVRYYTGQEEIFEALDRMASRVSKSHSFVKELPGIKQSLLAYPEYTGYLQLGYRIEYKCGSSGFCEVKKTDPYTEGYNLYKKCGFGCIKTVRYLGKIYHDVCVQNVCATGSVGDVFCDPKRGNDVYYKQKTWWCDIDVMVAMYCGTGGRCAKRPEGIGCYPIEGGALYGSNNSVQYALTMPQGMEGPIYVVAMQNGKVIAKKPISNLSAEEYVARYGPIRGDQAYAFAQKLGLTSLASAGNASRTSAQSLLSRGYSYRTSSANWNSSAIGTRTRVFTRSWRYNNASVTNSYRNWYSYYRTYSYRPTTRYSYYYRPKSTYSYSTYYRTYRPATYTRSYYSRYGYYNRYYRPYGSYSYASSGNRYRRYYYCR